jgi:hypothetical protein
MRYRMLTAWLACLLPTGCIGSNPPYPLYPNPDKERPSEEVAILMGEVAIVDGKDVSPNGRTFALEPGCHIVRTPKRVGGTSASGAYWADIGEISFAMDMQAHHVYVVRINVATTSGMGGSVTVSVTHTRGQRASRSEPEHLDRRGTVRGGVVAEFTVSIVAPTFDASVDDGAGVVVSS